MQLLRPLTRHTDQILQIIPRRGPEPADEIPRRALQVAVVAVLVRLRQVIVRASKVRVRGDGRGALEALQPGFGLGGRGRVEVVAAEELVRGDALLGAEFLPGVLLGLVWGGGKMSVGSVVEGRKSGTWGKREHRTFSCRSACAYGTEPHLFGGICCGFLRRQLPEAESADAHA